MNSDVVMKLTNVIKTEVIAEKNEISELLKDNKIIVSVLKGPEVSVRVIKVSKTQPRKPSALSEQTIKAIKTAKKTLANNLNALYLLTLLAKAKEVVLKLDVQNLTIEGTEIVQVAAETTIGSLSTVVVKLVEHKK